MHTKWSVLSLATAVFTVSATTAAPTVEKQTHGLTVHFDAGVLRLEVWSDRAMRVTFAQGAALPSTRSLSVISTPSAAPFRIEETTESVNLSTAVLEARIDKSTALVTFTDSGGNIILRETGTREPALAANFTLGPDEQIYGLGQHQGGQMSYRGTSVHLQQKNMEIGIPMLFSSRGYGLFWDNPAITDVQVGVKGQEGVLRWNSETGRVIDYYFLYGPKAEDVVAAYRKLTGPAPLMPKWLWGFWQCKERYSTQAEMLGIVTRYRRQHMPLDGIVQDWQYWKPGGWGSATNASAST